MGCVIYTFKGVLTAKNLKLPSGVIKHPYMCTVTPIEG